MNLTPEQFISELAKGKTEKELNRKEILHSGVYTNEVKKLIKYGHTLESALEHLNTDYSNGFTICKHCGSFYSLGNGFTKHLSDGCLHCEGSSKHDVHFVDASTKKYGGFPARYMSKMFDDGLHYCKDKLQIEKFKDLLHSDTTVQVSDTTKDE